MRLLFFLLFWVRVAPASPLHPLADLLKNAPNSRISITRYSGHKDFHSQQGLSWSLRGGKFFADRTMSARLSGDGCENFLATQQQFPLSKMAGTSYIQKSSVDEYIKGDTAKIPGQVNFLTASRDLPQEKVREFDLWDRRVDLLADYDGVNIPIATATMRTVSGQWLDPWARQIRPMPMPWQSDSARAKLAREFDRGMFPFVWEVGRVAQDLPREAEGLGAAAAMIMYQELIAMGGRLEDGWVTLHSLSEVNTRAYSMRFPNRIYPEGWADKSDALFLVPLAEWIQAAKPETFSGKLAKLIELSDGRLNATRAMDFLFDFGRAQYTQLDLLSNTRPLALRDVSTGASQKRLRVVHDYGLNDIPRLDELADFLLNLEGVVPTWNSGQYPELADISVSTFYYRHRNAIEISNLEPESAAKDPNYIMRMLISTATFYMKSLVPGAYDPAQVTRAAQFLRDNKVMFGVTTFDPAMQKKLEFLRPVESHKFEYPTGPGQSTDFIKGMEWMSKGYVNPPRAYLFSMDQIFSMIEQNPEIYRQAMNNAVENYWIRHLYLSTPDVF